MSKVINKIIAETEDGENGYEISVLAKNVIMDEATGLTLKDFYDYLQDYFTDGDFMVFDSQKPQSPAVKFWYKEQ